MMRFLISLSCFLDIARCHSLRSGSAASHRTNQADYQSIQIPSLDSPGSPDQYSGVDYESGGSTFSLDVGATAMTLGNSPTPNPLVIGFNAPDYGMVSPRYNPPAVSHAVPLNAWSPPPYTVVGCSPSSNNKNCSKGMMSGYNLGMSTPLAATALPRVR